MDVPLRMFKLARTIFLQQINIHTGLDKNLALEGWNRNDLILLFIMALTVKRSETNPARTGEEAESGFYPAQHGN